MDYALPTLDVPGYKIQSWIKGRVWQAVEEGDATVLAAIKIVEISNKINKVLFDNETEIWNRLEHKYIIPVIQIYEYANNAVIIMEATNSCLSNVVETHPNGVTFSFARNIFYQLCVVVKFLHSRGIAHLNLHPGHILLKGQGDRATVQLIDFGCATVFQPNVGIKKTSVGCDFYRAPEIEAKKVFDPQLADIWSLGIILHVMLTGTWPFSGFDYNDALRNAKQGRTELSDHLPAGQRRLIESILRIHPQSRCPIDDILSDPWIKQAKAKKSKLSKSEGSIVPASSNKIKRTNSLRRIIKKISSSSASN